MLIAFLILFSILLIKQTSFWVYLWQLKGYRWDRFRTEYGRAATLARLWVSTGGRTFRRPTGTPKAVLIFLASLGAITMLLYVTTVASASPLTAFVYFLCLFLITPFLVSLIVWIVNIPSALIKGIIYQKAQRARASVKNLTVIGITGSYGKSSTKEFLFRILSEKYRTQKTPENINSEIGIAKFIINSLRPDTEMLIVEMGAYRIGEIKKSCNIARPTIAILTGLNEQHLGLFGSLANIKQAKFELIESLPSDGFAAFNGENEYCRELANKWQGKKVLYRHSDVAIAFDTPMHYRLNIAGAAAVAKYVGMSDNEIQSAIESLREHPIEGNVIKKSIGRAGAIVIDDTYSENPDGIAAALDYLASQKKEKNVIVMPCIIELGDSAPEVHERVGKKIAEICDRAIIITPNYFPEIQKMAGSRAMLETDPAKIIEILRGDIDDRTAILLEGKLPEAIKKFLNP